jgi:hypothetical protein
MNGRFGRVVAVAACATALLLLICTPQSLRAQARPPGGFRTTPVLKTTPKSGQGKTPASKAVGGPLKIDSESLPPGYEPPPAIPDLMLLDNPLTTREEQDAFRRQVTQYRSKLRGGATSKEERDLIQRGLRYRLYEMTFKENERNLHKLRDDFVLQDLRTIGGTMGRAQDIPPFRRYVLDEVLKLVEPMLQNSYLVRLHAAALLGELELTPLDPNKGLALEMYTPACELLLKVLADKDQPLPVKITAARSLIRHMKFGRPPVELKHRIAQTVIAELAKVNPNETHWWYQVRLIEVLALLDVMLDLQTQKPFIVDALLNVLNDPKRDWQVRAEAARALGRVPFPPQVQAANVMRDVMQFGLDLSKAAQQDPANPINPQWKLLLLKLYLAFQAKDAEDLDATKALRAGLLNSRAPGMASLAQQTLPLLVPIVNEVLAGKRPTAPQIQAVDDWVQKNKPNGTTQANAGAPGGNPTP